MSISLNVINLQRISLPILTIFRKSPSFFNLKHVSTSLLDFEHTSMKKILHTCSCNRYIEGRSLTTSFVFKTHEENSFAHDIYFDLMKKNSLDVGPHDEAHLDILHLIDKSSSQSLVRSMKSAMQNTRSIDPPLAAEIIKIIDTREDWIIHFGGILKELIFINNINLKLKDFLKNLMEFDLLRNPKDFTIIFKLYLNHHKSSMFFDLINLMEDKSLDLNIHYIKILELASKYGNADVAKFCFDRLNKCEAFQDHKCILYEHLIGAITENISKRKKVSLEKLEDADFVSPEKVFELVEEMKITGCKLSHVVVGNLIKSHLLSENFTAANEFMTKFGIKPGDNQEVDDIIIATHLRRLEFSEAKERFHEIRTLSVPTLFQYNEMMRIYKYTGDIEKVEELFKDMLGNHIAPNVYTQVHRVNTCVIAKKPELCLPILEDNASKGYLGLTLLICVLRDLVSTGNVEYVGRLIVLIRKKFQGKVKDHVMEEALLLVNIRAGNFSQAREHLSLHGDDNIGRYLKTAQVASANGDAEYVAKLITFLKINQLDAQPLDNYFIAALEKNNDFDGIQEFCEQRFVEGGTFHENTLLYLESLVKKRSQKI